MCLIKTTASWISSVLLFGSGEMGASPMGAEIEINADIIWPQTVTINRGDSIRWVSVAKRNGTISSFAGDYDLGFSQTNDWSVSFQYDLPGTNIYRRFDANRDPDTDMRGVRSGIIFVRDWTNAPPVVTLNAPQDGDIFNCCGFDRESIAVIATSTINSSRIARVEFVADSVIVATATNAPYFVIDRNLTPGNYRLVARVIENDGGVHESAPVNIAVEEIVMATLAVKILPLKNRKLVMVSWLEGPYWSVMNRDIELEELGTSDISSTSTQGVRFWIEPSENAAKAFFRLRRRS